MPAWWQKVKSAISEPPAPKHVCGRCANKFPNEGAYLDHRCPAAGFHSPREREFSLRS